MLRVAAIILILLVLNVVLFFLLWSVVKHINRMVKRTVAESLSVYDRIIEKKEQEIEQLNEQLDTPQLVEHSISAAAFSAPQADISLDQLVKKKTYADLDFFKNYEYVKETFKFDYQSILKAFVKAADGRTEKTPVMELSQALTPEVQFNLLSLSKEEQIDFLRQILTSEHEGIINDYLAEHDSFDILEFCEYLEWLSKNEDNRIIVRMGYPDQSIADISENICLEKDAAIVEGMKIIYHNVLYDYSI